MARIVLLVPVLCLFYASLYAQKPVVLIVYHSETGNTQQMAEAVAAGAAGADVEEVLLRTTETVTHQELIQADAIIVGSPVYNANVSPEISRFIASWPFEGEPLRDKIGAAFVTGGGISAGEELVQMSILQSMLVFGMIVAGGPDWTQPFGASAITSEAPFQAAAGSGLQDRFLAKGQALGERIALLAIRMASE
ncbi:MAG: flavodoxin family protein [Balneolaceae bacterium]|nr:MAG: flavodoxin family protein [Balneolaceae bacterium]